MGVFWGKTHHYSFFYQVWDPVSGEVSQVLGGEEWIKKQAIKYTKEMAKKVSGTKAFALFIKEATGTTDAIMQRPLKVLFSRKEPWLFLARVGV